MSLASMTGYARVDEQADGLRWTWELRSVNGKGLDVRSRLPAGYEPLDVSIKPLLAQFITRGSVSVTLTVAIDAAVAPPRINESLVAHYAKTAADLHAQYGFALPTVGELMGLRGVLDMPAISESDAESMQRRRLLPSLDRAAQLLATARREEGARLLPVLQQAISDIERQTGLADEAAKGQPAQVRDRLTASLADLLGGDARVDPDRLAQEVALLATKADVREEIDRLTAHVAAARSLLTADGPVGRQFDFLAQEFNREANTLCSKSTTPPLTATGLALKTAIDQLREQVANIE